MEFFPNVRGKEIAGIESLCQQAVPGGLSWCGWSSQASDYSEATHTCDLRDSELTGVHLHVCSAERYS